MAKNSNKKQQRAFHGEARNTWSRKPMTQVKENDKAYSRQGEKNRLRQALRKGDDGVFSIDRAVG